MKGSGKIITKLAIVSALMVFYVHGHFMLFKTSYNIQNKEEVLQEKQDAYRLIKFEVDQMKAPRVLEKKMSELDLELELPDDIHVVKLHPTISALPTVEVAAIQQPVRNSIMDFLGQFVGIAQANTEINQ